MISAIRSPSRYSLASRTPSFTWERMTTRLIPGVRVSWTLSVPTWFSGKYPGLLIFPTSGNNAATRHSSGLAPIAIAPASARVPTTTLWWNVPGASIMRRRSRGWLVFASSMRRISLVYPKAYSATGRMARAIGPATIPFIAPKMPAHTIPDSPGRGPPRGRNAGRQDVHHRFREKEKGQGEGAQKQEIPRGQTHFPDLPPREPEPFRQKQGDRQGQGYRPDEGEHLPVPSRRAREKLLAPQVEEGDENGRREKAQRSFFQRAVLPRSRPGFGGTAITGPVFRIAHRP